MANDRADKIPSEKHLVRMIRDYVVSEEQLRSIIGMRPGEQIISASKREWEEENRRIRGILIETEEGHAP